MRRSVVVFVCACGGLIRIYRAHHTRLADKRYAVKILLGDFAPSVEMRIRFANEAKNASRLDHPNIVRVVDFGRTTTGLLYLVMELVEGVSLGALIRSGLLDRPRALALIRQLCDGLAHAHAQGVVHRDFKPDNILVVGDTPRIVDFGLAISTSPDDPRLTASGVLCTPAYAAPEQLTGGVLDHRVDLYALGVTMFEMLAGRLPFSGDAGAMMACKLARALPLIPPSIPHPLAPIILKLVAPDPRRRFYSAREVIGALDRAREMPVRHQRSVMAAAALAGVVAMPWQLGKRAPAPVQADPPAVMAERSAPPKIETRELDAPRARGTQPVPRVAAIDLRAPARIDPRAGEPAKQASVHVEQRAEEPTRQASEPVARASVATPARHANVVGLDVAGPLPVSVIRRAIDRVDLRACAGRRGSVSARFTIGETRRASELVVTPRDPCIAGLLAGVRTEVAPDVGDTHVVLRIAF